MRHFEIAKLSNELVSFDGSLIDAISEVVDKVSDRGGQDLRMPGWYGCANTVFTAAAWTENFENDAERKQTFEDAIADVNRRIATFALTDYAIHTLPKASVPEQIEFVRRYMD